MKSDFSPVDYKALEVWLKKHPNTAYNQFKKEANIKASSWTYYTFRKDLRNRGVINTPINIPAPAPSKDSAGLLDGYRMQGTNKEKYEKLALYLKDNPDTTHRQIQEDTGIKIASSSFTYFKRHILKNITAGKNTIPSASHRSNTKKRGVYLPVFSVPMSEVPTGAKDILKKFVACLNDTKRTRMQVVVYDDPKELEIRELS